MIPAPLTHVIAHPKMQRARGTGRVVTYLRGASTCLDQLYQDGCAKIRLPRTHSDALEAILINTAGGLTGGDILEWGAEVAADGQMILTTQACERSYRSTGATAEVTTRLKVGRNAHLDWLPQETILFAGSRLARILEIDLDDGATLTAIEAVLLGRDAMGEEARDAVFTDDWRIRRNGRLVHAEATRLDGRDRERDALSLLDGARAIATIVHLAADADRAAQRLAHIRAALPPSANIAASQIGERVVVRASAPSGLALRRLIVPILIDLTGAGNLPRLWHL